MQVLNVVRGDDVELVRVLVQIVFPVEAERVQELAAGTLDEQQVPHVVQDIERVQIVEVHALQGAEGHGALGLTMATAAAKGASGRR